MTKPGTSAIGVPLSCPPEEVNPLYWKARVNGVIETGEGAPPEGVPVSFIGLSDEETYALRGDRLYQAGQPAPPGTVTITLPGAVLTIDINAQGRAVRRPPTPPGPPQNPPGGGGAPRGTDR